MKKLIVIFFFFMTFLFAQAIDITQNNISLLPHSDVYIGDKGFSLSKIIQENKFKPYRNDHIRIGNTKNKAWIAFTFKNDTDLTQEKIIVFSAADVENILFYDEKNLTSPDQKGQAHTDTRRTTLLNYFKVQLPPHSEKKYYAEVYSEYSYLNFFVTLMDESSYKKEDRQDQFINIFLIGIIFALMLHSLFVSFYSRDKSYFFYAIYLLPLLVFQMKFTGLTGIYMPKTFVELDMYSTALRLDVMLVTNALFAMYFLNLKRYKKIYYTFVWFIIVVVSTLFLSYVIDSTFIALDLAKYLGLFLMIFNLSVAIYVYVKGYKQARLYIVGFLIVFMTYIFLVTDSFELTSVLSSYRNLLLWGTAFEALILSLAFADRYLILQKEKERNYALYLEASKEREHKIEEEVKKKTRQLSAAIETKEVLLQEVHHRVKNNLQIIFSMIQLQNQSIKDEKYNLMLNDLGNRVNAIAKTYEMLVVDDDLDHIDMKLYIESLVQNIYHSLTRKERDIGLEINVDVLLSIKEAVYIGLILNEIITNAYKYAFDQEQGLIKISFHEHNSQYELIIEDNGKGFDSDSTKENLGLKLIRTLVQDQLQGNLVINSNGGTRYEITFTLSQYAQQI